MTMTYKNLVKSPYGLVDRRIFVDKEIYQQELEQIFGRCWLFVGHETQIPKDNDFLSNYMGEDPVLLTRDAKGKPHVFLNMCRHRGNRVCRADFGNSPSFMCTYHGWTFAADGKLVGVPGYKEAYFEELDRSQWGLVEARVETYKGLVFATWDRETPSLLDYLGDMAWFWDMMIDRREGGVEVIGGAHKWMWPCNWKLPEDNFGSDGYHLGITHGSMLMVRAGVSRSIQSVGTRYAVAPGNGHSPTGISLDATRPLDLGNMQPIVKAYYEQHRAELEARLGATRAEVGLDKAGMNSTTFPNLSTITSSFRISHPRGPEKTEAWSFLFVDKAAPREVKEALRNAATQTFGPSGNMEQDDQNNFVSCTTTAKSLIGRKYPVNLQLGIGHESQNEKIPGTLSSNPSEINQRGFYARWAEIMDASGWAQISLAPAKFGGRKT